MPATKHLFTHSVSPRPPPPMACAVPWPFMTDGAPGPHHAMQYNIQARAMEHATPRSIVGPLWGIELPCSVGGIVWPCKQERKKNEIILSTFRHITTYNQPTGMYGSWEGKGPKGVWRGAERTQMEKCPFVSTKKGLSNCSGWTFWPGWAVA